jgi:thiamine-monophosphate kinase
MSLLKKIGQIGEFELIEKIQKFCSPPKISDFKIQVPNGDDAFAVKIPANSSLVFTTDTLVEDTHFNLKWMQNYLTKAPSFAKNIPKNPGFLVGYKAMAVNLSDFAAMGDIQPLFAFLTLGLHGDISVDFVDNLLDGIQYLKRICGYFIAGGDIIRSEKSIISITIVGRIRTGKPIQRFGAKIGDLLMASGPLGLSFAGLKMLKKQPKKWKSYTSPLVQAHLLPKPQLKIGAILATPQMKVTSLMDLSDDLMTSLEILKKGNQVGFEVDFDSVPLHPALIKASDSLGCSPYEFMVYGGEDYQLLFTVPPSKAGLVQEKIPSAFILGEVKPFKFGIQLKLNQQPLKLKDIRYKHF